MFERLDASLYPATLSQLHEDDPEPSVRNKAQDILWTQEQWPVITVRVRREAIDALDNQEPIWHDADGFMSLLRRLWV